jgi:hypothetical protein
MSKMMLLVCWLLLICCCMTDSRQLAKKTGSDGLKPDEVPEGVAERASVDSTLEEVNIHGKNDIFREEMKGAIDRGRIDLATEALALCGSGDVEEYDLMWSSAQYTAIVFDVRSCYFSRFLSLYVCVCVFYDSLSLNLPTFTHRYSIIRGIESNILNRKLWILAS